MLLLPGVAFVTYQVYVLILILNVSSCKPGLKISDTTGCCLLLLLAAAAALLLVLHQAVLQACRHLSLSY
jgi:hypothetical protein